jgi:pimeloyl-ACP methyl ester carboxylesterase
MAREAIGNDVDPASSTTSHPPSRRVFLASNTETRPMTPVFFLPGAAGSPLFWRPLGDRLPADRPKVYFGWPGLGDQPADRSVNSLDDLVAVVEGRLGRAPVDLLAQSMGGVVAVKLALKRPDAIRRMVLSVTSGGVDAAARARALHDWRVDYRGQHPNAAPWIYADGPDLTGEIHRIACPVLLLFGDADPIAPPFVGERLNSLLPDARLAIIRGGDHSLVANRVDEVLPLVAQHLG